MADPTVVEGKRVLVVKDGPTLTHGGMQIGAGVVAAKKCGARELVDPRPFLVGKLRDTFATYPNIGALLPAMGYGTEQLHDLEATIRATDCDAVVIGTPIDLARVIQIDKPHTRVFYDLKERGTPNLDGVLTDFIEKHALGGPGARVVAQRRTVPRPKPTIRSTPRRGLPPARAQGSSIAHTGGTLHAVGRKLSSQPCITSLPGTSA